MKTIETKQTNIQEKRNFLRGLSKPIQALVKEDALQSVNEGLKLIYGEEGHEDLKTIRQWNKEGKRVKKGEKALLLWGSPRVKEVENKEKAETGENGEVDELSFFPICYVFSQKQVQEAETKRAGKEANNG